MITIEFKVMQEPGPPSQLAVDGKTDITFGIKVDTSYSKDFLNMFTEKDLVYIMGIVKNYLITIKNQG